jgi:hypothetical protein
MRRANTLGQVGSLTGAPSSCPRLVLDPGFGRT